MIHELSAKAMRLAAALAGLNSKPGTGPAYGVDRGRQRACEQGCCRNVGPDPTHDDGTVMNGAPRIVSGPTRRISASSSTINTWFPSSPSLSAIEEVMRG